MNFNLKELIDKGISEGVDLKKMLLEVAESYNSGENKNKVFHKLYNMVYGNHLCNAYCKHMVEEMFNKTEKGEKWTIEQINDTARKSGITFNNEDDYTLYELYAVMHMIYYENCEVFHEQGISSDSQLYAKMADAYLDSDMSKPGRLADYFFFLHSEE